MALLPILAVRLLLIVARLISGLTLPLLALPLLALPLLALPLAPPLALLETLVLAVAERLVT